MTNIASPSVEFRAVRKAFGAYVAVKDISFAIERGTLVTLLGPSGCGKTTTLRLIAGLEIATSGAILIDGIDVTRKPAAQRDVSMVFQSYALFPHMSVLKNVAYGLVSDGIARQAAEDLANEALALVGLSELGARLPSELSGGQQQRVAVARAVALRPAVLLFDEPLSNLDAKLRRHVRDEIRDLQQRLSLTAVYVTHDQTEAMAVSDRVIVMDNARIAQDGTPRELYRRPANRFVAGFVGEANVVSATLRQRDPIYACVELAGLALTLPHHGLPDGPVELAIRSEAIRITAAGSGGAGLEARVLRATFLGSQMEYQLQTAAGRLFVSGPDSEPAFEAGQDVVISLDPSGVSVMPTSPT